jgi:NAD(P)-dependent dehydrogenase (short-subunit alcohol dehydrogenase family)
MADLAGKVAIVTGGSSGMGRGTAERFVAEGAKVVIADINQEIGEEVAGKLGKNAAFKKTDVSDRGQIRDLVAFAVKSFGGLHIMMNNAGISGKRYPEFLDDDFSDFERVIGVNLLGVMVGTREASLHMSKNGGGSIINVSSIGGVQPGGVITYGAAKAAVIHFGKSAALNLGKYGIRVNCILPANIETPIMGQMMGGHLPEAERAKMMKGVREFLISRQPLQLQGQEQDIAEAALYFASDRSRYVTGTTLPVDGGMLVGSPATGKGFGDSAQKPKS